MPGKPKESDRFKRPAEVLDFATLYRQNCAGCHGAEGKLGPAPPLNDPLFLAIVPSVELEKVITEGRPGTPMAAFARERGGNLTETQVRILAAGLKPKWGAPPALAEIPLYWLADARPGSREAGLKAFGRACAACHGDKGQGGHAGAVNNPAFLALISDQALRRIIITGRPDLGMPDFAGTKGRPADFQPLSTEEIADLVALLASWRRGE